MKWAPSDWHRGSTYAVSLPDTSASLICSTPELYLPACVLARCSERDYVGVCQQPPKGSPSRKFAGTCPHTLT